MTQPLSITLETDPSALATVKPELDHWLRQANVGDSVVADVTLATWEAAVNAVEYSKSATFQILGKIETGVVSVRVRDDGDWIERALPRPERGRGIGLMRGLMDQVQIEGGAGGTSVLMHKKFAPGPLAGRARPADDVARATRGGQTSGVQSADVQSFRVIVVVDGQRTIQLVMPFEQAPAEGDVISLPSGTSATVRHVLEGTRDGLDGIVLAWAA